MVTSKDTYGWLYFVKSKGVGQKLDGYFNEGISLMNSTLVKAYGYGYFKYGLNHRTPSTLDVTLDYIDLINRDISEHYQEMRKVAAQAGSKQKITENYLDFDWEKFWKYLEDVGIYSIYTKFLNINV